MDQRKEQFVLFRIRTFKDPKAFESLVREYGPKIERFLKTRLPRHEDVQDANTEVWTRAWTYSQTTKIESVSGLLYTIARSVIAGFYKNQENCPETLSDTGEDKEVDTAVPLHEDLITKVDVGLLKTVMQQLSNEEAQVILMRYIEGFRVKEIAKQIGKTENATSVLLHRSVNKLRELIRNKFGEL